MGKTSAGIVGKTAGKTAAKPAAPEAAAPAPKVPAATVKAAPEARPGKEARKAPARKPKLVRDSFTFPEADYAQIGALKERALKAGREVKKSELLRAGLKALAAMSDASLFKALDGVDKLKPGRPAQQTAAKKG